MASLDDAVSTLKGVSTNLSQIWLTIKTIFPQSTGTSFTATAGTATLPAQPGGFINITLQNGSAAKVAWYPP